MAIVGLRSSVRVWEKIPKYDEEKPNNVNRRSRDKSDENRVGEVKSVVVPDGFDSVRDDDDTDKDEPADNQPEDPSHIA